MKRINQFITRKDLFGHFIQLNFNRKSNGMQYHKTFIGGSITFMCFFMLSWIAWINGKKWAYNLDDKNTT